MGPADGIRVGVSVCAQQPAGSRGPDPEVGIDDQATTALAGPVLRQGGVVALVRDRLEIAVRGLGGEAQPS